MSGASERQIQALLLQEKKLEALRAKYTPHSKQELILEAIRLGHKQIFVRAGRQSGKTRECCDLNWLTAGLKPNSVCTIITPTLKQAKKIYWKRGTIQNFGPRDWLKPGKAAFNNEDFTIYFKNGSYIEIDGSDNIDAHRGDKKDLVVLDEYKDIDPRFYPEVIEPMFATTSGVALIIGTPPETPESHYKELELYALADPDWYCIHWTSYDSPYTNKVWLDKKRDQLEARGELDVFKREYLAEYTVGGKNSVFPMWARATHMRKASTMHRYYHADKDRYELYWICDPSTSRTFASLFIAYRRETGQVLVLDEICGRDKSKTHTKAIYEEAKKKMAPFESDISRWHVVYDDAAAWFANELYQQFKVTAQPARKATKQQEEGISLFKDLLLKKNTVVVSDLCTFFAIEIENYIMKDGKYPLVGDDFIDCFRYFLTFANVVLSLAEENYLSEDEEEFIEREIMRSYESTGLPRWTQ